MSSNDHDSNDAKRYPSPPLSHGGSFDSDADELRALELADGPVSAGGPRRGGRGRSFSLSGFAFENDLLPLTSSLDASEEVRTPGAEKSISLLNGTRRSCLEQKKHSQCTFYRCRAGRWTPSESWST